VPCGIPGVVMTSVARERGEGAAGTASWEEAVRAVMHGFETAFGVATRLAEPETQPS